MKTKLKKLCTILLLFLILFNFIFNSSNICYADDGETDSTFGSDFMNVINNIFGSFIGIFTWPIRLVAIGVGYAANALTAGLAYSDGATDGTSGKLFISPYDIFFNKIQLFDVNFVNVDSTTLYGGTDSIVYKIRIAVSKWYETLKLISVAGLLVILIYVGIRMALSVTADDKVKYKKMFADWVVSLVLVYILQYIIYFTVAVNDAIVAALDAGSSGTSDYIGAIAKQALGVSVKSMGATIVFCMLVWQTFGYVVSYINRTVKLAFLVIISPLISITYSIDKIGDGKSQALNGWLKEFCYTVLIQPFHCIIYMSTVGIIIDLFKNTNIDDEQLAISILIIVALRFMKEAEGLLRNIFAFKNDDKGTSLNAGTAVAAGVLAKSKDIAKGASKLTNTIKNAGVKDKLKDASVSARALKSAVSMGNQKDANGNKMSFSSRMAKAKTVIAHEDKVKEEEKILKKYRANTSKMSKEEKEAVNKEADKLQSEDPSLNRAQALRSARLKFARKKIERGEYDGRIIRDFKRTKRALSRVHNSETMRYVRKNVIPAGFGLALGSATYGGDSDLFTSVTAGIAGGKTIGEMFKNSSNTIANDVVDQVYALDDEGNDKTLEEIVEEVKADGDADAYDDKHLKKQLEKLRESIRNANVTKYNGNTTGFDGELDKIATKVCNEISSKIQSNLKKGNLNFNMDQLITEALSKCKVELDTAGEQSVVEQSGEFKKYKHKAAIYDSVSNASNVGISLDDLIKKSKGIYGASIKTEGEFRESIEKYKLTENKMEDFIKYQGTELSKVESIINDQADKLEKEIKFRKSEYNGLRDGSDEKKKAKKEITQLENNLTNVNSNKQVIADMKSTV